MDVHPGRNHVLAHLLLAMVLHGIVNSILTGLQLQVHGLGKHHGSYRGCTQSGVWTG